METTILVRSSSRDEPYAMTISSTDDVGLSIFCDCPAGVLRKHCKHKLAVALGDTNILYDEDQIEGFHMVSEWIAASKYRSLAVEIRDSEMELEARKKEIKGMKEKMARLMRDGLK